MDSLRVLSSNESLCSNCTCSYYMKNKNYLLLTDCSFGLGLFHELFQLLAAHCNHQGSFKAVMAWPSLQRFWFIWAEVESGISSLSNSLGDSEVLRGLPTTLYA